MTIPVSALDEAGLHPGDQVVIESLVDGEVLIRRSALTFEDAFGALTGTYPPRYLEALDEEDARR
ncbi:MAG: AbrB/MazE/SpoVT family DNA-binding domain-containing protein [Candidatus Dormibacteraeota bacterium]|nr:AbrB/MazE/SpoVT family DNA-binding domain-containing protein [Candidatus Dormibacteraeota bacterium]